MKPNARAALRNPAAGAAQEGAGADEAGEAGADGGDVSRSDLCVIKMMLKQQIVDDHEVRRLPSKWWGFARCPQGLNAWVIISSVV